MNIAGRTENDRAPHLTRHRRKQAQGRAFTAERVVKPRGILATHYKDACYRIRIVYDQGANSVHPMADLGRKHFQPASQLGRKAGTVILYEEHLHRGGEIQTRPFGIGNGPTDAIEVEIETQHGLPKSPNFGWRRLE